MTLTLLSSILTNFYTAILSIFPYFLSFFTVFMHADKKRIPICINCFMIYYYRKIEQIPIQRMDSRKEIDICQRCSNSKSSLSNDLKRSRKIPVQRILMNRFLT